MNSASQQSVTESGSQPPLTWQQVCEVISGELEFRDRRTGEIRRLTPQQVFEYSPAGELSAIPEWYGMALEAMRLRGAR